ncbi:MAG TPA: hypothetical protein VG186_16535 [Solirubrobacteraceae bacterium]|nr:hypothetical protein [Solirubrobacteraceae bacterium]
MSKVFSAHAVSVDGYISGRDPSDGDGGFGRGLGDAGMLFDWYSDGDTPSQVFGGFRLSEPSARVFDALAARVGAAVAGRTTYEHSSHFGGGGPHPTARLFVLSHRWAPEISGRQTLLTTGIADAIAAAREAAGDKDAGLMGGGVPTSPPEANLADEAIHHHAPIPLDAGRSPLPRAPKAPEPPTPRRRPAPGATPPPQRGSPTIPVTWRADNPR